MSDLKIIMNSNHDPMGECGSVGWIAKHRAPIMPNVEFPCIVATSRAFERLKNEIGFSDATPNIMPMFRGVPIHISEYCMGLMAFDGQGVMIEQWVEMENGEYEIKKWTVMTGAQR